MRGPIQYPRLSLSHTRTRVIRTQLEKALLSKEAPQTVIMAAASLTEGTAITEEGAEDFHLPEVVVEVVEASHLQVTAIAEMEDLVPHRDPPSKGAHSLQEGEEEEVMTLQDQEE